MKIVDGSPFPPISPDSSRFASPYAFDPSLFADVSTCAGGGTCRLLRQVLFGLQESSSKSLSSPTRKCRRALSLRHIRKLALTDSIFNKCRRRDLNPHSLRNTILSRARLPFRHSGIRVSLSKKVKKSIYPSVLHISEWRTPLL